MQTKAGSQSVLVAVRVTQQRLFYMERKNDDRSERRSVRFLLSYAPNNQNPQPRPPFFGGAPFCRHVIRYKCRQSRRYTLWLRQRDTKGTGEKKKKKIIQKDCQSKHQVHPKEIRETRASGSMCTVNAK